MIHWILAAGCAVVAASLGALSSGCTPGGAPSSARAAPADEILSHSDVVARAMQPTAALRLIRTVRGCFGTAGAQVPGCDAADRKALLSVRMLGERIAVSKTAACDSGFASLVATAFCGALEPERDMFEFFIDRVEACLALPEEKQAHCARELYEDNGTWMGRDMCSTTRIGELRTPDATPGAIGSGSGALRIGNVGDVGWSLCLQIGGGSSSAAAISIGLPSE